jgi:hypothetical protein
LVVEELFIGYNGLRSASRELSGIGAGNLHMSRNILLARELP